MIPHICAIHDGSGPLVNTHAATFERYSSDREYPSQSRGSTSGSRVLASCCGTLAEIKELRRERMASARTQCGHGDVAFGVCGEIPRPPGPGVARRRREMTESSASNRPTTSRSPGTVALALAGCVAAVCVTVSQCRQLEAQVPRVRDSAGVQIVENPSRATAPVRYRLGPNPLLDVGGLQPNPNDEFDARQGTMRAVRLSNRTMAVIDVNRIQMFSANGQRITVVGRAGSGPAEFRSLLDICATRGDSILVGDVGNSRIAILDGHGSVVRTLPSRDIGYTQYDSCFDDGTFVATKLLPRVLGIEERYQLIRVRLTGTVANVLGEFTGRVADFVSSSSASMSVAGQWLYFGSARTSDIWVLTPTGRLVRIIRSDDPPVPVSDADVERRLAARVPSSVTGEARERMLEQLRGSPHATTWPTYGQIHSDSRGRLWVQDYRRSWPLPSIDTWTLFDAAGKVVGRLVIAAPEPGSKAIEVLAFGDDDVVVRRWDNDGAGHITIYRLLANGRVP